MLMSGNKERKMTSWAAHRAPHILSLSLISMLTHDITGSRSLALTIAWIVMTILGWVSIGLSFRHEDSVCSRCGVATPLDPDPEAERYRWALWIFHRRATLLIAVVIISIILIKFPIHPWNLILSDSTAGIMLIIVCRATLKHLPLVRGCPECHGWDGDDEEEWTHTPEPQPVGHKN